MTPSLIRQFTIGGASAIAMTVGLACSAKADPSLPGLTNLEFLDYTGSAPKGPFSSVDPVGWTGGTGLIFIDSTAPGLSAAGPVYLTTYGNPSGSVPGNYVEADGNPSYESGFNFKVTGLTVGQTYTLSFYQGASEQTGFGNPNTPTTNRWIVSLGTAGLDLKSSGETDPLYGATDTYYSTDPNASIVASPLMTVPYGATVGWDYVSVTLTADATTDLLSFLAFGDNGSTVNLPPIAFLAGINSPPGLGVDVPEPATLSLIGVGFVGIFGSRLRRGARRKAAD